MVDDTSRLVDDVQRVHDDFAHWSLTQTLLGTLWEHSSSGIAEMAPVKLQGKDREDALKQLEDWKEVEGRDAIQKKYVFKDFKQAWAFMSKVAEVADKVSRRSQYFFSLTGLLCRWITILSGSMCTTEWR